MMLTVLRTYGLYRYLSVKAVSNAPYSFEKRVSIFVVVEFLAQVLHMHVEHVAESGEVEAPDVVEHGLALHRFVRVAHEELEERELLEGQRYLFAAFRHRMLGRVEG